MSGKVISLTTLEVVGWAVHPVEQHYAVLIHVVHRAKIIASAIADQPPPSKEEFQQNCWFHINLSEFNLSDADLNGVAVLVGETDEILMRQKAGVDQQHNGTYRRIEDIIFGNFGRRWVVGRTYLDAERAGVCDILCARHYMRT